MFNVVIKAITPYPDDVSILLLDYDVITLKKGPFLYT